MKRVFIDRYVKAWGSLQINQEASGSNPRDGAKTVTRQLLLSFFLIYLQMHGRKCYY